MGRKKNCHISVLVLFLVAVKLPQLKGLGMEIEGLTIIGESINDSVPSTQKMFEVNDIMIDNKKIDFIQIEDDFVIKSKNPWNKREPPYFVTPYCLSWCFTGISAILNCFCPASAGIYRCRPP